MNKSIMLMCLFVMSVFSAHAVEFDFDQTNTIYDYRTSNLGMSIDHVIVGSLNDKSIGNQTGDLKHELRGLRDPVYILLENGFGNVTIDITYVNDDVMDVGSFENKTAVSQELTMEEKGVYYFKFTPTYEGESFDILIDLPDANVMNSYLKESRPLEFNSLVSSFITSFQEIVELNVSIWRLTFYSIVFIIVTGFVAGLFAGSFYIFKKSRELKKEGLLNHK